MPPPDAPEATPALDAPTAAAGIARASRYRFAYNEQLLIHRELVAEAGRLAELIEARLAPSSTAPGYKR